MAEQFHVVIASIGLTRYEGPAISLTLPGTAGEMTLLAHHEPLVTTLRKGTITVRQNSNDHRDFEVDGGVLEVSGNRAVVLL